MSDGLSGPCDCAERLGAFGRGPLENRRLVCGHGRFGEPAATTGLRHARMIRPDGEGPNPSGSNDVRCRGASAMTAYGAVRPEPIGPPCGGCGSVGLRIRQEFFHLTSFSELHPGDRISRWWMPASFRTLERPAARSDTASAEAPASLSRLAMLRRTIRAAASCSCFQTILNLDQCADLSGGRVGRPASLEYEPRGRQPGPSTRCWRVSGDASRTISSMSVAGVPERLRRCRREERRSPHPSPRRSLPCRPDPGSDAPAVQ